MTDLKKPLKRKTRIAPIHGLKDEIVVTLYPGGTIGLREAKHRREYTLSIGFLYQEAIRAAVIAEKRLKKMAKKK
ncbi:hypothetical protein HY345_04270 [Candidatus Microgenomates bacterium]|nr:hypothetical protein [Candidatus Microgenomates bacterium]